MDRNREARRASIVGSNGFNRRRHRTNSLRDSPDEDGGVELQESVRLRERVKKDRERERDLRERERDLRERPSRNNHDNKRRRAERLTEETSDESVNDDEDEEDEDHRTAAAAAVPKMLLTQPAGSVSNHGHGHGGSHHNGSSSQPHQQQNNNCSSSNNNMMNSNNNQQHLQHRKSFPPASSSSSTKVFRAPPVWKSGDEMIGVPVPRKARTASTKRSHDWISSSSNNNSGGGGISGGEQQIPRHPSSSPVRQGLVSTPLPAAPMSPSSSNVSIRKKLKPSVNNSGPKLKPPKSKPSSSNPEELEIEIAEVLYGLMTQSQGPSSKKEDSREVNRSRNSSPISNSTSGNNNPILGSNSTPLAAVAPKRKRPRHIPENSSYGARGSPVSAKPEMDQTPKSEISSPTLEKVSGSTVENGFQMGGNLVNSRDQPPVPATAAQPLEQPTLPVSTKLNSELKAVTEELGDSSNLAVKEEVSSPKEKESPAVRLEESTTTIKSNSAVPEMENQREEKFEIDLMAPPPERETDTNVREAHDDQKPVLSINDTEMKSVKEDSKGKRPKDHSSKSTGEEGELHKNSTENKERNIDLGLDLEKFERDENCEVIANGTKLQIRAEKPPIERSGQSTNPMPLPISMANWPGGLPPMGYMAPLQGVVSMDGTTVTPAPIQPLFTQPRPKRCATHCHIARNIYYIQQFTKMNPFWPANPGSASLFGSKPCNLNAMPDLHGNIAVKGVNNAPQDKGQRLANIHNHVSKDKISQPTNSQDSAQRKQQILIQQTIPPVPPNNLLGPAFIFPLNQQQAAITAATRPSGGKSQATVVAPASSGGGASATSAPGGGVHFNFPTMAANETQYLAILQNNGYPFPIPTVGAPPNYRAAPGQAVPMFNGSFYSSQMIHPPPTQPPPQLLQAHTSGSNNSSSSQKHSQRPQSGNNGGPGNSNLQNFSAQKSSHNQNEPGSEDSPSNASRASMNIYGPNFAMPIHNFALMAQQASNSGNQTEKKQLKAGVDSIMPPQSFAMSFGPGVDMASLAQNHAIFQASSESTRQNIQMMDDERKRQNANVGQSIVFTRSDSPVTTSVQTSNATEGPTRSLNPTSGPARGPRPTSSNVNAHYQAQLQQQQMMQQFKQQQQQQMAVNRSKDHVNSSSSMAAKFPNALTGFPQNLVPGNSNSPSQSKAPNSQSPSNATSLKNLPQQHSTRTQPQMHTQISFGNQKPSTPSQGQAGNSSNRALSPPMVVNSPTTSSMSKGASSSPRSLNPASSNNKSSPSIHTHTQKSPPSILGNPHTSSNSSTSKPQIQQQHTKALQHPLSHPFFSNPYAWAQPSHSKGTNSTNSGYMQRRRPEQHQQSPGGAQTMSSTRDLSLSTTSTNDPAKAIAAATCNVKGIIHASQFADAQSSGTLLPAGFSYAVQAKPAEQKQPNGGNDNLHAWQPEKK